MFDFAWSELALIAIVALIVIGPKDLPRVMRVVGQWTRRARAIAREFQGSLDQMVREAELDDIKRHLDRATSFNVENEIRRAIDPRGEIQQALSAPVLPETLANPLADPPRPAPLTEVRTAPLDAVPAPPAVAQPQPPVSETLPPIPVAAPAPEPPGSLDEARAASGQRPGLSD